MTEPCDLCGCDPDTPPADRDDQAAGFCYGDCGGKWVIPAPGSHIADELEFHILMSLDPDGPHRTRDSLLFEQIAANHERRTP